VQWWQSGQSLQPAQWRTPAQARQCRDQAAATSREQNFLVAGTLVSGPFRAAVGVLKEHASLVAEQFRTPPPVAQASRLVKGANVTARSGPTPPTWALQQVSGYPGYTGRDANIVAQAARDLKRTFDMAGGETRSTYAHRVGSVRAGGIGRDFTFSHAPLRQANSASSWSIRDSPSLSVTSSITRSLSWTIR